MSRHREGGKGTGNVQLDTHLIPRQKHMQLKEQRNNKANVDGRFLQTATKSCFSSNNTFSFLKRRQVNERPGLIGLTFDQRSQDTNPLISVYRPLYEQLHYDAVDHLFCHSTFVIIILSRCPTTTLGFNGQLTKPSDRYKLHYLINETILVVFLSFNLWFERVAHANRIILAAQSMFSMAKAKVNF